MYTTFTLTLMASRLYPSTPAIIFCIYKRSIKITSQEQHIDTKLSQYAFLGNNIKILLLCHSCLIVLSNH
jgi:hypothetical protein